MLLQQKQANAVRQKMIAFRSLVRAHVKLDGKSYKYPVLFNSYKGRTYLICKNILISGDYER